MEGERIDDVYTSYEDDTLLVTRIVSAFGLFAFVVAMAGVYGVMAFIVSGRRREIGIRMALGAGRGEVSRLVLVSSLRLTLAGAGLGIVCALGVSHWVKSQLFGIAPTDPVSYVLVTVVIVATALVATWHPAHSASRVDPAVTLRAE
jgi:ABC-type antimicrobial peptide transport system permease subunit